MSRGTVLDSVNDLLTPFAWLFVSTVQGPVSFFSSLVICEPLFTRHEVIRQRACWELLRAALTHSESEVSVPVYRTKPLCNRWQSAERCCLGETPWHVTMVIPQINMSAQTFFIFFLFCRGWVHICECSTSAACFCITSRSCGGEWTVLLESVQRCLILVCIPAGTGRQLIRPPDRQLLHITADWTVHAKVQRRVPSISYSATGTCLFLIIIMCWCFCFTRLLSVCSMQSRFEMP